ncbi:MAG: cellulase family glycosylhydrolase [Saccharofermentanales bacterium]
MEKIKINKIKAPISISSKLSLFTVLILLSCSLVSCSPRVKVTDSAGSAGNTGSASDTGSASNPGNSGSPGSDGAAGPGSASSNSFFDSQQNISSFGSKTASSSKSSTNNISKIFSSISSISSISSTNSISSISDSSGLPKQNTLKRGLNFYFLLGGFDTYVLEESYYETIKDAGFDHIRLAVDFSKHCGPAPRYLINESYLDIVDAAITNALKQNLIIILDMHFDDLYINPSDNKAKFLGFWKQLSMHYKSFPEDLYFEILNEPNTNLTEGLWNIYLNEAISVIRQSNPDRMIVTGPTLWYTAPLEGLEIPENDKQIIVTIHCYTPMEFTHQGAEWLTPRYPVGVTWKRVYEYKISSILYKAQQWAISNNRKVWLGEFGAYHFASNVDRIKYMSFVSRECEKRDIPWAYWEFCFSFGLYDLDTSTWSNDLLNALVPRA